MFQFSFPLLWKKFLKIKGTLLGRRWFRPALQETGKRKIQIAKKRTGSTAHYFPAVSLADGRAAYRTAQKDTEIHA